jgi:PAS domain S-box-containing protein
LHATGIAISDKHQEISRVANRLLLLQPSNVAMLLTYSRYLNDIINNEYYAHDIFSLAFGQRLNFKSHLAGKKDTHAEKEAALFGENGFCSIFILRTDFRNLGVVEFANHEVHTMFGYRPEQLIGKDISCIMPESIGSVHRQLMMRFFDKGESPIINKFRELFVRDSDGYLVPVLIYPKVLPNLTNGLKFIGAIKRIATLQDEDLLGGAHLPQNDL